MKGASGMAAFRNKASPSYEAINQWMLMKRDLLNITIDTDKIDEQPLTASELLLRMKLMAYVQKLVDKEAKKKPKKRKKRKRHKPKQPCLDFHRRFMAYLHPSQCLHQSQSRPRSISLDQSPSHQLASGYTKRRNF